MWYECLKIPEREIPTDPDDLRRSLGTLFRRASERCAQMRKKRIVVYLDAVNQMDDEGLIF